tara:strand:+ start:4020 stop:5480 length:1461 start_codon:yes stop_codon:yes gene_type:complete
MGFVNNNTGPGTGAFPASIQPMPDKVTLPNNYINFQDPTFDAWTQQYLPELYEAEVERYGNRTLSGFLRMVGAEMPMTSDQVIWSEQNRLHIAYEDVSRVGAGSNVLNIPGNNAIKINNTIVLARGLITVKCLVTAVTATQVTALPYTFADLAAAFGADTDDFKLFVYGSEFPKGVANNQRAIEPEPQTFANNPVIIKDYYEVSGSDTAQIGWIEIAAEDGSAGYFWYLKSEAETRLRFEDYLEMMCVEGEIATGADITADLSGTTTLFDGTARVKGTQGLFAAIEERGNIWNDFAGAAAPGAGALGDFDAILKHLDKQGAIEENMLFLDRATALDFDDMIAAQAGGGYASTQAASYGLFDNEAEMALNFGFAGFRRGSYDFYKTDWKYLNDATTRGLVKDIEGVLIPAGTSTVYDQMLGQNIRRPFLHVRYRASQADDRRYKSWITGSVGGAYTSNVDAMQVNFLSERCLVTQAANNFVLFKATV